MKNNITERIISSLLAVLMLLSLCVGLTSCDDVTDAAIDILEDFLEEDYLSDTQDYEEQQPEIEQPEVEQPEVEHQPEELPPEVEQQPEAEQSEEEQPEVEQPEDRITVDEDGEYDDFEHVALYIHLYGKLPKNYITKKEAENLGWSGGSLEKYAKGKCIGGSYFGNYEGALPKKKGREYHECDIDTLGEKSRGAKRIVYSNDGLIYYTDDHYETFTLLYGEE